jgi:hypothetical protein
MRLLLVILVALAISGCRLATQPVTLKRAAPRTAVIPADVAAATPLDHLQVRQHGADLVVTAHCAPSFGVAGGWYFTLLLRQDEPLGWDERVWFENNFDPFYDPPLSGVTDAYVGDPYDFGDTTFGRAPFTVRHNRMRLFVPATTLIGGSGRVTQWNLDVYSIKSDGTIGELIQEFSSKPL